MLLRTKDQTHFPLSYDITTLNMLKCTSEFHACVTSQLSQKCYRKVYDDRMIHELNSRKFHRFLELRTQSLVSPRIFQEKFISRDSLLVTAELPIL